MLFCCSALSCNPYAVALYFLREICANPNLKMCTYMVMFPYEEAKCCLRRVYEAQLLIGELGWKMQDYAQCLSK